MIDYEDPNAKLYFPGFYYLDEDTSDYALSSSTEWHTFSNADADDMVKCIRFFEDSSFSEGFYVKHEIETRPQAVYQDLERRHVSDQIYRCKFPMQGRKYSGNMFFKDISAYFDTEKERYGFQLSKYSRDEDLHYDDEYYLFQFLQDAAQPAHTKSSDADKTVVRSVSSAERFIKVRTDNDKDMIINVDAISYIEQSSTKNSVSLQFGERKVRVPLTEAEKIFKMIGISL